MKSMGNIEGHNFPPVRDDERQALNLSRRVNLTQYVKHHNGEFSGNCLTELPWSIRDSVSLYESMDVSFNALTEIPVELPLRLPHLSYLDLGHNQLQALPTSFGLLFHLKELYLQHNRLSSLPESFVRLFKLEKVDVSHNYLVQLPADIGNMECLGRLNVVHNRLKVLPLSLGSPSCHLNLLLAQQNILESPPQAVCDEGSSSTLGFIRKQYLNSREAHPPCSTVQLNNFPRFCGNKSEPSVSNPHSAQIQYIQEQTNTTHTTNRVKAPLLPPFDATTLSPFQLRDRIIGCDEGSSSTLGFIRKQYLNSREAHPPCSTVQLNNFPRFCGNKSEPSVSNPHSAQIQYIQEQTNTTHTTNRVKAPLLPPFDATTLSPFQLRDRIIGLVYGAAIGDAIGVSCRWMSTEECAFHYGSDDDFIYSRRVQDEHRVLWKPGSWTSNFEQLMLVLESLVNWAGVVDELEFARRLHVWVSQGYPDLGGSRGVVTSETVKKVVAHPDFCTDPHKASKVVLHENTVTANGISHSLPVKDGSLSASPQLVTSSKSSSSSSSDNDTEAAYSLVYVAPSHVFGADNGALLRTAILGVPNFHELGEVESNAVRICKTTHSDSKCVASCVFISLLVSMLLQGNLVNYEHKCLVEEQLVEVFERASAYLPDEIEKKEFLALRKIRLLKSIKARDAFYMSHTYMPVKAALAGLHWRQDYRSFITALTKLGGDSSSNACVAGAVLGCSWGFQRLPRVWVEELCEQHVQWLNSRINHLLDILGSP